MPSKSRARRGRCAAVPARRGRGGGRRRDPRPQLRDEPALKKFHGLARSLVANAVQGVSQGFKRELDIVGIGYRAEVKGKQVVFALGYSHPVVFDVPPGSRSASTSRRTSP
jgi:ribosomal protein L6P/L9E